jgi:hypothetical protein
MPPQKINSFNSYLLRAILTINVLILSILAPYAYFFPKDFEKSFQSTTTTINDYSNEANDTNGGGGVNMFVVMVSSFWLSILICSLIGICFSLEEYMEPVLLVQIVYKLAFVVYFFKSNQDSNEFKKLATFLFLPSIIINSLYFLLKLYDTYKQNDQMSPRLLHTINTRVEYKRIN